MAKVYMLCEINERGDEVFKGMFESESLLLEALPERSDLKIEGDRIVRDLTGNLSGYRVKTFEMNTLRPDVGEIDLPDESVTIESMTYPGTFYGIALSAGKVVACTCPSFRYASDDDPCKHMSKARNWPSQVGLEVGLGGNLRVKKIPYTPAVQFYGYPSAHGS